MDAHAAELRIDIDRLLRRLDELASIGAIEGTEGCCRLALTDEDRLGRDLVVRWMEELGLTISIDRIGNVVGVLDGRVGGAPVMCGSHIDTVALGGRYDGNLGVLAGLEVIESVLAAGIVPDRPLAVAFFTDEEGARFAPDMLGSLVYVGGMPLEEALDIEAIDGAVLGAELGRIGYAGSTPVPGLVPAAFVELHIEQGPVLEAADTTIGVVTGVQGISWQEITITGQSNHAGTTPMDHRRDPGYVAACCLTHARDLAHELGPPQVATVGRLALHPNLVNVVAAEAQFTIDLRNTDEAFLAEAERRFSAYVTKVARTERCKVKTKTLARFKPVAFDETMISLVESTARRLGHTVRRMPSGAGHDAQMLARICPTSMIFVPSQEGVSHNPAEHTAPLDLEAGTNVLLQTMLALALDKTTAVEGDNDDA
ncbi:MAG: Zn-dependent hydrolase [Actinomycetia bacterium]|nr:Zn-dependent hydrolase [Actinomycetes bacterium]